MTWQDISSAPKDGTWILLFEASMEMPVSIGAYNRFEIRGENGKFIPGEWGMAEWDGLPSHCSPTHWMPLPDPPEALA
jgi:hypothetical protein